MLVHSTPKNASPFGGSVTSLGGLSGSMKPLSCEIATGTGWSFASRTSNEGDPLIRHSVPLRFVNARTVTIWPVAPSIRAARNVRFPLLQRAPATGCVDGGADIE